MRALLASPREEGRRPGVILIHEAFGLNTDMREKAQRFADMGYVALAPDLYSTRGRMPFCMVKVMSGIKGGKGPVMADLEACRAWLCERPEVDPANLGVIGFCMGGGIALLFAVQAPVGAAGVFYGSVPSDASELEGACPVVAGFGGRDRVFGKNGRKLERHLQALGVAHDVVTYPAAGHSYMSDHSGLLARINSWGPMRVGYDPEAAEDSWERISRFFGEHFGSKRPE